MGIVRAMGTATHKFVGGGKQTEDRCVRGVATLFAWFWIFVVVVAIAAPDLRPVAGDVVVKVGAALALIWTCIYGIKEYGAGLDGDAYAE